jgi:hypothetical protein
MLRKLLNVFSLLDLLRRFLSSEKSIIRFEILSPGKSIQGGLFNILVSTIDLGEPAPTKTIANSYSKRQSRIVLSSLPLTIVIPSALIATEFTEAE